jgi:LPXTG-motif cell wall-anchored protein
MIGEVSCPRTDLAPGGHMTCTGTRYVVTSNDASQQTLANHATAHATSCPTSDTCSRVTDDDTLSLPTTSNTHLPDTGSTMPPWATPAALATLIAGLVLVATGRRRRR